ncbi:MAG: DUF1934 domain-containing protein [Cellulosilyticaceae bacterium]
MKQSKLKIISTQIYDTHEDLEESIVEASTGERNGAYYILFKEIDKESKITTNNTIKIKQDMVTIKRNGGLSTDLSFDINKVFKTIYYTPYHEMEIEVITHTIEKKITNNDIILRLEYTILMQGQKISDNIYMISNYVE